MLHVSTASCHTQACGKIIGNKNTNVIHKLVVTENTHDFSVQGLLRVKTIF